MPDYRIVALAAGRGGSAKTTLTYALGDVLHRLRAVPDVALLDLDPQANLTSYAGQDPVDDPLTAPSVSVHGLTVFRGGRALSAATVAERARFVERVLADGTPDRVVIADLPPALHDPSHRVLLERDDVLWMGAIRAEPGSFQSLNELVAMCARAQAPYVLVPTFYVTNRSVIAATTMALRSQHAGHVSKVVIPDDSKAKECVLSAMPVTMFAPRAKASQAVIALADEVFGKEEEAPASVPRRASDTGDPPATSGADPQPAQSSRGRSRTPTKAIGLTAARETSPADRERRPPTKPTAIATV